MRSRVKYIGFSILIALVEYTWSWWYYKQLYLKGNLLSATSVTIEILPIVLAQHFIVTLPVWIFLFVSLLIQGHMFHDNFGFKLPVKGKRVICGLVVIVYLIMLLIAFIRLEYEPITIIYLWIYYFLFVAFTEEAIFRGLLPWLMKKSGVIQWYVWIIPGVLFACMHSLMPLVVNGFSMEFIVSLFSSLGGFTLFACGLYYLRCWSNSLWLPIFVHAILDFVGVLF